MRGECNERTKRKEGRKKRIEKGRKEKSVLNVCFMYTR